MDALLLIDFQNDFFPLGTVEARGADSHLVTTANRLMHCFDHVLASCDEHPGDHVSFAANHLWRRPWQVMQWDSGERLLWPMHCVAGSFGAEWAPGLDADRIERSFAKGIHPASDGHSAFESETLAHWLTAAGIQHLFLMGTLLEYSVTYTALDAVNRGFLVTIIRDGCAFLDIRPGDAARCREELLQNGINEANSYDLCPER